MIFCRERFQKSLRLMILSERLCINLTVLSCAILWSDLTDDLAHTYGSNAPVGYAISNNDHAQGCVWIVRQSL